LAVGSGNFSWKGARGGAEAGGNIHMNIIIFTDSWIPYFLLADLLIIQQVLRVLLHWNRIRNHPDNQSMSGPMLETEPKVGHLMKGSVWLR
jgi:hypothetical protein